MAINLEDEQLLSLADAARALPRLRGRKRVHVSTLHRWVLRGVRGVRLEATRLGRTLVTSREALQRFSDRLNSRERSSGAWRSTSECERAEKELDRHGL